MPNADRPAADLGLVLAREGQDAGQRPKGLKIDLAACPPNGAKAQAQHGVEGDDGDVEVTTKAISTSSLNLLKPEAFCDDDDDDNYF